MSTIGDREVSRAAKIAGMSRALSLLCTVMVLLACAPAVAEASSYGRRTVRGSGTALQPTDSSSYWGAMSSRGRHVAFQSYSSNLSGGGVQARVFVRDMRSTSTRLVSVSVNGATPDGASVSPSISSNGRVVAFASRATNLMLDDTNGVWDVFVRDMATTSVVPVSVSTDGALGNGDSSSPVLCANGTRVAFISSASNLVTGDGAGFDDVFVRDLAAGTTVRLTRGIGGGEANGHSSAPSINADGSKVAFVSRASNLVVGDTNGATDVFVVDVATLDVSRVSVRGANTQANLGSYAPSISGNGRKVAFESLATNLVSKDTNGARDVFVRDLGARSTVRASVSSRGVQGNAEAREPSLSHTGTKVAFSSPASNLVGRDTNGCSDVFVRNLSARTTARLNTGPKGQASSSSGGPVLSSDGWRVAYHSASANLVLSDSNKRNDVFVTAWGPRAYDRVKGSSTYATAVEASKRSAPAGAGAAVIVNVSDWRSAIAGASLAGTVRGPILYVGKDSVPAVTRAEIVRLGAARLYVIGGTGKVSSTVASDLAGIVGAAGVERVGSGDSYSVANAVASLVVSIKGSSNPGTVLVVTGNGYLYTIPGLPLASAHGRPIVFVNPSTGSYRLPAGTKRAIILGPASVVSRSVESRLKRKLGKSRVSRLSSSDRYVAAVSAAKRGVGLRHTWDGLTLVNVAKPAEAISGAVMAGRLGSVVLYTGTRSLPRATRARLAYARYRIDQVHIMGSTSSISSSVHLAVKKALGG
jgi:Tol biopolymer transport system component